MAMDFSYNDVLEHIDLNNMLLTVKGWGTRSGLEVSDRGAGANMSVDVAAGSCITYEIQYTESSTTNVVISAADATHPRKDLIIYDSATSAPIAITGSPAATPQPPDITSGDILLALVDVSANATVINNIDITDKRILMPYHHALVTASDVLLHSNDTERYTSSGSYVKLKEIEIPLKIIDGSVFRIKFDMKTNPASGNVYGKIYRNGATHGTQRVSTSSTYITYSEDLAAIGGDLIQIYGFTTDAPCYIRNFRLYGDLDYNDEFENTAGY